MWRPAETNTHQDHVIAHVIGARALGYFVWDETAYLLLDIGFIWNVYLDGEMGLLPHPVVSAELEADEDIKSELRSDIDSLLRQTDLETLTRLTPVTKPSPIQSVDLFESDSGHRLILNCETSELVIETSLESREIQIS